MERGIARETSCSSYGYMNMLSFDSPIFSSSMEMSPLQCKA